MSGQAEAGAEGFPPYLTVRERTHEVAKYETLWSKPQYRAVAPGEDMMARFLTVSEAKPGAEVIDFGAGTGRGALALAQLGGLRVHAVDFAINCLDPQVKQVIAARSAPLDFLVHDLNKPLPFSAEFGYCTDVLEHIPPGELDKVLDNILVAARYCFFTISNTEDACGVLVGETLHLSLHDYEWWREEFKALGAKILHSEDHGGNVVFYVSSWIDAPDLVKVGRLNIGEDVIRANVAKNVASGWLQCQPHLAQDRALIIIGGGPSLDDPGVIEEIKELRAAGAATLTLNGAYHWALEHGVYPGAQVVCDAREHNARFTRPVIEGCKYLIASQCDPATFEGLPPERTFMWHTTAEVIQDILNANLSLWFGVPGGSTVLLRTIPLMKMMGWKKFHLFGCDSCLRVSTNGRSEICGAKHHSYSQPENDGNAILPVNIGGRVYYCHPWMASQCQEFMDLIRVLGNEFEVEVHGDGLLAWVLQHVADEEIVKELTHACAADQEGRSA